MDKLIAEFEGSPAAQHTAGLLIEAEADGADKLKLASEWIKLINSKRNMLEGGVKDEGKQGSIIDAIKELGTDA